MKKTSDILREMRERFARENRETKESQERSLSFVEKACNAGLLDDVEPDGPMPTDQMTVTCGHCGKVLTGPVYSGDDWLLAHMSKCSSG